MYMYPDLTTIHQYLCLQFFVQATYTGKAIPECAIPKRDRCGVSGIWYLIPGTVVDAAVFLLLPGTSTATKTKQMHAA